MLEELIRAFSLVFVAEMGDKTQIIAMTFASKYKVKDVLIGVTIGVLLNHGLAILLGNLLSKIIPLDYIQIIAGIMFIVFGFASLKEDNEDDENKSKNAMGAVTTVALAFFIGELGDKTQLTSMTLATDANYPLFILFGATLGMLATSSLGIFVGSKIGDKIPDLLIKIVSSVVFIVFGCIKLFSILPSTLLTQENKMIFSLTILLVELLLVYRLIKERKNRKTLSPIKNVARNLYLQTQELKNSLDSICLGEGKCGKCSGSNCLIGYTKFVIKEAREKGMYYNNVYVDLDKFIKKDFDKKKVSSALKLILNDYIEYGWEEDEKYVVNKVKSALEVYLFDHKINNISNIQDYLNEIKKYDKNIERNLNFNF